MASDVETVIETKKSQTKENEDPIARGNWSSQLDFILTVIGFSIGVGNVFRFPYICFKHGGGTFLLPYSIALICCGIPLMFLELSWGQYCSEGPITAWAIAPGFTGTGVCAVMLTAILVIYYNIVMCYGLFYFFASFTFKLPWKECDPSWKDCVEGASNFSGSQTPSQSFLFEEVLHLSSGWGEIGYYQWKLLLCLALAWIITFFCVIKGVKSTGKVVYFTATFPYVILFALFCRAVTLEGAIIGIKAYVSVHIEKIFTAQIWIDAFQQVFYSLGPGWGGLLTFASYNHFNHNVLKDTIIVALISAFTSIFAGFVIFSILGFLSLKTEQSLKDVVAQGLTVAFEAYPEALVRMPLAPLWSIAFFFMVILLGMDSEFGMLEALINAVIDACPRLLRPHKLKITIFTSILFFLIGSFFVTRGGFYYVNFLDTYVALFGLLAICFLECIVVSYVYGVNKFSAHIKEMMGFEAGIFFKVMWMAVTPFLIVFILYSLLSGPTGPLMYAKFTYPPWSGMLGVSISCLFSFVIPLGFIFFMVTNKGNSFKEKIKNCFKPNQKWCSKHATKNGTNDRPPPESTI